MLKNYLKAGWDLLFPLGCFACQRKIKTGYLCSTCQEKIRFLQPSAFSQVITATEYKEPLVSLIHLFKYQHCDYLGGFLSQLMIKHLENIGFSAYNYHCITAVPLHRYKLKMRGYNQAEVLASFLSNHFRIPLRNDIISVTSFKPSQTKLGGLKRQNNVKGIFSASNTVKNLNFLLIDDIFTTGSTVFTCSKALKEKGANIITVLTLSKTVGNRLRQQSWK